MKFFIHPRQLNRQTTRLVSCRRLLSAARASKNADRTTFEIKTCFLQTVKSMKIIFLSLLNLKLGKVYIIK